MARKIYVDLSNTIESWRQKTNLMSDYVGDLDNLNTDNDTSVVNALNSLKSDINDILANTSGLSVVNGGSTDYVTLSYSSGTNTITLNASDLVASNIPALDAGKIVSGIFDAARIPSLPASKITTGTFSADRIPDLPASKVTSGFFDANRIPSLPASKVTSGVFDANRIPDLPASKIIGLTDAIDSGAFPTGGIIMWSGAIADIPDGWVLCDGDNDTPDLRDRFIVGAGDSYAVDDIGGFDEVTLDETEIPSHSHSFSGSTNTAGSHNHNTITIEQFALDGQRTDGSVAPILERAENTGTRTLDAVTNSAGSHSHTFSGTIGNTGGGEAHENRPPYYALAFIMKI